jgi:GT2 family glycosyltransferase
MNRLTHLRETLPVNIVENSKYNSIEFVILDYNSGDGMEDWAKDHLQAYIDAGIIKYYKTYEPAYFSMAHSKNMALKLATGDIICLVDADNYAGPGYASWINAVFESQGNNTVITTIRKDQILFRDQGGKLCMSKEIFHQVNGFDESLRGYGIEDVDMVYRLERAGGRRHFIEQEKFLKYIGHSTLERLKNYQFTNNLDAIFAYIPETPGTDSDILYFFKDNTLLQVSFTYDDSKKNDLIFSYGGWSIKQEKQKVGNVTKAAGGLVLEFNDRSVASFRKKQDNIFEYNHAGQPSFWKEVNRDEPLYNTAIMGYGECSNRNKLIENRKENTLVNATGLGQGTVYLNFNTTQPIVLT